MSSFRKSVSVLRELPGVYVAGVWVAGSRSIINAVSSVQPVTLGQDLKALPEGRHLSNYVKLYSADLLQVAAEDDGVQSDIIIHQGYGYELSSVEMYQSGLINHYKYIAYKIFKYTSDAEWLAGNLVRP